MNKYLSFVVILVAVSSLCSCKSADKYTLSGCCKEWKMPEDGIVYLSVLDLSKNDIENVIEHTRIGKDGSFKFSGYVKEPQIVMVFSINQETLFTHHGMCILEGGDIEMDCESYEVNRGFFDCVGRGTPTNDRLRDFYSVEDSILRECVSRDGEMFYAAYPEVDNHRKEYMNENKNDFSSVFLAMEALYSGASPEDIPDEIINSRFVKTYIDMLFNTEDGFDNSSIIIDEEIIPINID